MTIYLAAKFLHITGAVAVFSALGLEFATLRGVTLARSASAAQSALTGLRIHMRVGVVAMLLVLVPGIYLAVSAWGMPAWLLAEMGAMVAIMVLDTTMTRRSLAALVPALARGIDGESVEHPLRRLCSSFAARVVLLLGIVALMSMKPGWPGAMRTLAVAAIAAVLAAAIAQRQTRRANDLRSFVHE
jgi:hypothetical protein